jgi:hypothetical protein
VRLEKEFDVDRPRAEAAALLAADDVLRDLCPDTETEIVDRKGLRKNRNASPMRPGWHSRSCCADPRSRTLPRSRRLMPGDLLV